MTLPSSSRQTDTDPPSITTTNAHQTHTGKRKRKASTTTTTTTTATTTIETSSQVTKKTRHYHYKLLEQERQQTQLKRKHEIDQLETTLDYLKTDCILIDVVLKSLQSFFPIRPMTTEEQLDQVDKELGLAYDDMLNQIRALYRNVVKLDRAIKDIPSSHHVPSP